MEVRELDIGALVGLGIEWILEQYPLKGIEVRSFRCVGKLEVSKVT